MLHEALTKEIIGAYYFVYNKTPRGCLESMYQRALVIALRQRALTVEVEVPITAYFCGEAIGDYRLDLIVNDSIIVECKAAEKLIPVHEAQVVHYLAAMGYPLGLLLNFGPAPAHRRLICTRSTPQERMLTFKRRR